MLEFTACSYWYSGIDQTTQENRHMEDAMKDKKVRVDKTRLNLGKNGHHRHSGLGGMLIVVVR